MTKKEDPEYICRWPGVGTGRYWKRQLSKARRRRAKLECNGIRPRYKVHKSESECNWKTY